MRWVVFLRAVNVGGGNLCRPALLAKQLSKFGVVNIGAVGTFVVREDVSESTLRTAIAKKLPFKCEIMICSARDVIELVSTDPFAEHPSGPDITRFVNVLAKRLAHPPALPLCLASEDYSYSEQIRRRLVSPGKERNQLSGENRETAWRSIHEPKLEHNSESC